MQLVSVASLKVTPVFHDAVLSRDVREKVKEGGGCWGVGGLIPCLGNRAVDFVHFGSLLGIHTKYWGSSGVANFTRLGTQCDQIGPS